MNKKFKINLPILKTREVIVEKNGRKVKERYIQGVASSPEEDSVGDIMHKTALQSMVDSINQHIIELNSEHDKSWQSELGEVTKLALNGNQEMEFEAKLNEMSKSKDLWYALTELKKNLGVSIGGYVRDYELQRKSDGDWVRILKNVELDHIAVTSSPAHPKTWIEAIAKSINDKELEEKKNEYKEVLELEKSLFDNDKELINEVLKADEDVTNYPKKGDNKAVTLANSNFQRYPLKSAENLRDHHKDIWKKGGNIKGNQQFAILSKIAKNGGRPSSSAQEKAIRLREAWAARHYKDKNLAGVVAQVKWLVVGSKGREYMNQVIDEAKKKETNKSFAEAIKSYGKYELEVIKGLLLKEVDPSEILIIMQQNKMSKSKTPLETVDELLKNQTEETKSEEETTEDTVTPENGGDKATEEPAGEADNSEAGDVSEESKEDTATEEETEKSDESDEEESTEENSTEEESDEETVKSDEEADESDGESEEETEKSSDKEKDKKQKKAKKGEEEDESDEEESDDEEEDDEKKKKKEEDEEDEEENKSLSTGTAVIRAAHELSYAIDYLRHKDKDTDTMEKVLEDLKAIAAEELKEGEETSKSNGVDVEALVKKTTEAVSKSLSEKYEGIIKSLEEKVEKLSDNPAGRKGVELTKGLGDASDGESLTEKSKEELKKSMEKEIEDLRKSNTQDVFAQIQAVRRRYREEHGVE